MVNKSKKLGSIVLRLYQEGNNIYKINEITGLPMDTIILSIKDYDMEIDCEMGYNWINNLFGNTDLLTKKVSLGGVQMEINYINVNGIMEYKYEDKYGILEGFATPYWNGECELPINNVNYYHKAENEEDYGRDYGYDDEVVIKTPSRFNNLSELIEWFNNDYIELLLVNLKELSQSYIYDIL
jgi:hypothetical protein